MYKLEMVNLIMIETANTATTKTVTELTSSTTFHIAINVPLVKWVKP